MNRTFFVSLSLPQAEDLIGTAVAHDSFSGKQIDDYSITHPQGGICKVLVYQKYYYRISNCVAVTITLDDFTGKTRVHYEGGGGRTDFLGFSWGASESFENVIMNALKDYILS